MTPPRNCLSRAQFYALNKLIIETYAKSLLSDSKFAKTASEQLGFAVHSGQVRYARHSFEIPPNKRPPKTKPPTWRSSLEGAVLSLTKRVDELEASLIAAQRELAKCKGYTQPR